eukprot:scaffold5855_cov117-Isochrysis_galbana.AAC.12
MVTPESWRRDQFLPRLPRPSASVSVDNGDQVSVENGNRVSRSAAPRLSSPVPSPLTSTLVRVARVPAWAPARCCGALISSASTRGESNR